MLSNCVLLLTTILLVVHLFVRRQTLNKREAIDISLLYFLVAGVGVIGSMGFISHVFFADETAKLIGWPPGNPFQLEVGFHDGAWALLGFLCLRFRDNFWTATVLGWSFFMFGAAYGHIRETLTAGNFAPYNYGVILPDSLVPVILLVLLCLRMRSRKGG